jgi:hypothetical protein
MFYHNYYNCLLSIFKLYTRCPTKNKTFWPSLDALAAYATHAAFTDFRRHRQPRRNQPPSAAAFGG